MPESLVLVKVILGVFGTVTISVLGWVIATINKNQLNFARLDQRLQNQSATLIELKNTLNRDIEHRQKTTDALNQKLSDLEGRVKVLESHK